MYKNIVFNHQNLWGKIRGQIWDSLAITNTKQSELEIISEIFSMTSLWNAFGNWAYSKQNRSFLLRISMKSLSRVHWNSSGVCQKKFEKSKIAWSRSRRIYFKIIGRRGVDVFLKEPISSNKSVSYTHLTLPTILLV